jgi:hypothetical protein
VNKNKWMSSFFTNKGARVVGLMSWSIDDSEHYRRFCPPFWYLLVIIEIKMTTVRSQNYFQVFLEHLGKFYAISKTRMPRRV